MYLAFIHLNSKLPKYLVKNIIRTRKIFPNTPIVLISDQKLPRSLGAICEYFQPNKGERWESSNRRLSHPKDFRNNFWFHSISRFYALEEFVLSLKHPVLHIESDVMLSKDFPLQSFNQASDKILFPIVSEELAIASTIFFPNKEFLSTFCEFIDREILRDSNSNDMTILRNFQKSNPALVSILPSGPSSQDCYLNIQNINSPSTIEGEIEKYDGVFDGSDLGQFLFGHDPRNRRGRSFIRQSNPLTELIPSTLDFRFNSERDFVDIRLRNTGDFIKVYSLHIHSKNDHLFLPLTNNGEFQRSIEESDNGAIDKFYFRVFLMALFLAFRRRLLNLNDR